MFKVWMEIEGTNYPYGTYDDRTKANEVAMEVRDERRVWVWVEEIE